MSSYPQYDLTLETRDGETVELTTASFTRMGVAELAVAQAQLGTFRVAPQTTATIITAKQARELATALDKLAAFWGE